MQPIRLLCPWDVPGKDTGVGCHVLLRLYTLLCSKAQKSTITCKRRHAKDSAQQTRELTSATGHVSKHTFTPFEGLQLEGLHIGGSPGSSAGKQSACMPETWAQSLGWDDPPGERNGNPLQYSCLEHPMDRGAWWAIVHGFARVRHDFSDQTITNCLIVDYLGFLGQPYYPQISMFLMLF